MFVYYCIPNQLLVCKLTMCRHRLQNIFLHIVERHKMQIEQLLKLLITFHYIILHYSIYCINFCAVSYIESYNLYRFEKIKHSLGDAYG